MPPVLTPVPAPPARQNTSYGLLASANQPTDPPEVGDRWQNGFAWLPESCGGDGGIVDVCQTASRGGEMDDFDPPCNAQTYMPGMLWVPDVVTAMPNQDDVDARAQRKLNACTSTLLERELWSGVFSAAEGYTNLVLADEATANVIGDSDPIPLRNALASLETALAQCSCGGRGMIHAPISTVTQWAGEHLVRREGNLILTILNTIVVAGAGYDGSGPDGTPAAADGTTAWAYATGMVDVRLGRIEPLPPLRERMVRATNSIESIPQRVGAATFDPCCHLAVNVNTAART